MDFVFLTTEGDVFVVDFFGDAVFFLEATVDFVFFAAEGEVFDFFGVAAFFFEDTAGFAFLAKAIGFLALAMDFFGAADFLALTGLALVATFLGLDFLLEVARPFGVTFFEALGFPAALLSFFFVAMHDSSR